jgi:hypothetical protein
VNELARPRVGVVVSDGDEALTVAVVARTVTLSLLRRLPGARVEVLATGATHGPSPLDCGRPVRQLAADGADRQLLDCLVVVGDAAVPVRAGDGACPLVRLPGSTLDVAQLAAGALDGDLLINRVGLLRLLGWLPAAGTPHVVMDAHSAGLAVIAADSGSTGSLLPLEAGVDEIVAAVASASAYHGSHPLLTAIAAGAGENAPTVAGIDAALDSAAASALDCWHDRGSPGAIPDPTASRRISAENAALRVEIRRLEREVEALDLRANHAETQLQHVVGSKSWRYTEGARDIYRATRRRMGR